MKLSILLLVLGILEYTKGGNLQVTLYIFVIHELTVSIPLRKLKCLIEVFEYSNEANTGYIYVFNYYRIHYKF